MGVWVSAGRGHLVQVLDGGALLWEHDTMPGYPVGRHRVSSAAGQTWTVVQPVPLTLAPSLHCDPGLGGCGAHGWVRGGQWC